MKIINLLGTMCLLIVSAMFGFGQDPRAILPRPAAFDTRNGGPTRKRL